MPELTKEQQDAIIKALDERGAKAPCPRCGNNHFNLVGGYFVNPVQTAFNTLVVGGPVIPSAVVICSKCGYIAQHALGSLGLMPGAEGVKP